MKWISHENDTHSLVDVSEDEFNLLFETLLDAITNIELEESRRDQIAHLADCLLPDDYYVGVEN